MASTKSRYDSFSMGSGIEVVEVMEAFKADPDPSKINLSVGEYMVPGKGTVLMKTVAEVEEKLLKEEGRHHGYLHALGIPQINKAASDLLLGTDHPTVKENRVVCAQSVGGTGPLRVAAEVLRNQLGYTRALWSDPTWMNHRDIFLRAGYTHVEPYPCHRDDHENLLFDKMIRFLNEWEGADETVLILHASAHNPTGIDMTKDQWRQLKKVCVERGYLPFFDCAYQGFATGDLDADAWSVRYFASASTEDDLPALEVLVSQSFGKSMGLYGERIGFLVATVSHPAVVEKLKSQLTLTIRAMYSNPPKHGALIVGAILTDHSLFKKWLGELQGIVSHVQEMRQLLRHNLEKYSPGRDWSPVTKQIGMFYLSKLTPEQGVALREKHHVYMLPSSGRINIGALTSDTVQKLARAIADVVSKV